MKRLMLLIITILAVGPLTIRAGWMSVTPTPKPQADINAVTFAYDPNQVKYQYVGYLDAEVGQTVSCPFNWSSGDPNYFMVECENPPPGLTITKISNTDWKLTWKPASPGVYYINMWMYDSRYRVKVAPAMGTVIGFATPQQPVFHPMCGG